MSYGPFVRSNNPITVDEIEAATSHLYFPEDYGAAGDGATDDTEEIQLAINGASLDGGTVVLSRSYAISVQGSRNFGMGGVLDYALWVNADNVNIIGPGSLVIASKPDSVQFCAIVFGNGGGYPDRPGNDGTWINHVGLSGVKIDATALSEQDLDDIVQTVFAQTVVFTYCKDWHLVNSYFDNCWGGNGIIGSHASSREGLLSGNVINGGYGTQAAIWCDGARSTRIVNNKVLNFFAEGIRVQTNLDNCDINDLIDGDAGFCYDNIVANNHLEFGRGHNNYTGVGLVGCSRSVVTGNYMRSILPGYGVQLRAYAHHNHKSVTNDCIVSGNYGIGLMRGVWMWGYTANPLDGNQLKTERNDVTGNSLNATTFVVLGEECVENVVAYNASRCTTDFSTDPTAIDNVLTPNVIIS